MKVDAWTATAAPCSLETLLPGRAMQAMAFGMRLFGVISPASKNQRVCRAHLCYCVVSLLMAFYVFAIRFGVFSILVSFDGIAVFLVALQVWWLEVMAATTVVYCSFLKSSVWSRFFHELTAYRQRYNPNDEQMRCHFNKLITRLWIFGVFINIVVMAGEIVPIAISRQSAHRFLQLFTVDYIYPSNETLPSVSVTQVLFQAASTSVLVEASLFLLSFYIIVTSLLTYEFTCLNQTITQQSSEDRPICGDRIEQYRLQHAQLCNLVEHVDRVFGIYIAICYVAFIPLACFIFDNLIYHDIGDTMIAVVSFWLLGQVIIISALSFFAVRLSETAHEVSSFMYSTAVSQLKTKDILQLQIFMDRLRGPAIGFTTLGVLTITRETLLAFVATIITYLVLVTDAQKN